MSMRHTFKALWRAERERVSYICSIVYLWKNSLEGTVQRAATYMCTIIHKTMCCTYGGLASLTRQHACWRASTHAECSVMGLKHALPACSFGPRLVVACAHSFASYGWRLLLTMGQKTKKLEKKILWPEWEGAYFFVYWPVYCNPDSVLFWITRYIGVVFIDHDYWGSQQSYMNFCT